MLHCQRSNENLFEKTLPLNWEIEIIFPWNNGIHPLAPLWSLERVFEVLVLQMTFPLRGVLRCLLSAVVHRAETLSYWLYRWRSNRMSFS